MSRHPAKSSARPGFTLVELLVVIGIIALLISILLPSLQGARRAAAQVKCAAALRDLGNAFQMYAVDHKGAWPVVKDLRLNATGKAVEQRWTGFIAKYVVTRKDANYTDFGVMRNTVLWGCPAWNKAFEYNGNAAAWAADNVYTGYAMNYYTHSPDPAKAGSSEANPGNLAYIDAINGPSWGQYFKASQWKRPSERALLADSAYSWLQASPTFSRTGANLSPWNGTGANVWTDSARHLRTGTTKQTALQSKGANMLFCDGHVTAVTPIEAWNAIRAPGQDRTMP